MIIDTIEKWRQYIQSNTPLQRGFEFITETFSPSMKDGRYELPDDAGYANVQSYRTAPAEERKFEAHRKHIDIQYILSGEETIRWAPLAELEVVEAYAEERDAGFYRSAGPVTELVLRAGRFAVFYPSDAHMPGCSLDGPADVRKIVAKIRI